MSGPAWASTLATTGPGGELSFSYQLGSAPGEYTVATYMGDDTDPWTSVAVTNGPYVEADMPDYAPGNRVTLSGAGWQPNETVSLIIDELDGPDENVTVTAVADADGVISNGDFVTNEGDLGVHFRVTATGQASGYSTETKFKDGFSATSRATGNWNSDATWSITRPGKISWVDGSKNITGDGAAGRTSRMTRGRKRDHLETNDTAIGTVAFDHGRTTSCPPC